MQMPWEEDSETWEHFKSRERYRWLFNKLEVALNQNLHAGPAGTAPLRSGTYVSRPIYNIYGMGIGATKFEYDAEKDYENFLNHALVPPGHFWCEWLAGPQISIDYEAQGSPKVWGVRSMLVGDHYDENNLTKFKQWTKVSPDNAPHPYLMPLRVPWWGTSSDVWDREMITGFNVEMRSGKVVEIHLRFGNDPFDDLPIGTIITPVWEDMEVPDGAEFRGNLHQDMTKYGASGNLSNIRRGYLITRPSD